MSSWKISGLIFQPFMFFSAIAAYLLSYFQKNLFSWKIFSVENDHDYADHFNLPVIIITGRPWAWQLTTWKENFLWWEMIWIFRFANLKWKHQNCYELRIFLGVKFAPCKKLTLCNSGEKWFGFFVLPTWNWKIFAFTNERFSRFNDYLGILCGEQQFGLDFHFFYQFSLFNNFLFIKFLFFSSFYFHQF